MDKTTGSRIMKSGDNSTEEISNNLNSPEKLPVVKMHDSPIATSSEKGESSNVNIHTLEVTTDEEYADTKDCAVIEVPGSNLVAGCIRNTLDSHRISTLPVIPEHSHPSSSDSSYSIGDYWLCSGCTPQCCYNYNRCIRLTFHSPYTLPIYFSSMALPIAAGYMGATYMQDCPAGSSAPLFLFIIGLCGILCVASRIDVVQHCVFPRSQVWDFPSYTCFFALIAILLLLITEMMVILHIEDPDFKDPKSMNYCHPIFYRFTYYGNFVGFVLVLSSCILYLPRILCNPHTNMYPVNPYQSV